MRRHSTSSHVYVCRELPQAYERTLLYGSYGGIHTWLHNTVDMHRMATHGRTVDSNVRGLHPLGPGIIRHHVFLPGRLAVQCGHAKLQLCPCTVRSRPS